MAEMAALAPATSPQRRALRWSLKALGGLFVAIGIAGLFLPLVPAFDFFLLAAVCFARSSPVAYRWLTTNRLFGKRFKDYRELKGATLATKLATIGLLFASMALSVVLFDLPHWATAVMAVVAIGVTWHMLTLRTLRTFRD